MKKTLTRLRMNNRARRSETRCTETGAAAGSDGSRLHPERCRPRQDHARACSRSDAGPPIYALLQRVRIEHPPRPRWMITSAPIRRRPRQAAARLPSVPPLFPPLSRWYRNRRTVRGCGGSERGPAADPAQLPETDTPNTQPAAAISCSGHLCAGIRPPCAVYQRGGLFLCPGQPSRREAGSAPHETRRKPRLLSRSPRSEGARLLPRAAACLRSSRRVKRDNTVKEAPAKAKSSRRYQAPGAR